MIRVLHVITGLNTGGAETMLAKLVRATDPSLFQHEVITLLPPGPLAPRIREAGVRVRGLGLTRGAANPAALFRLSGIIRAARPDVVQTWLYHADLLGLLAARLAGVKRVVWNLRCSNMDFSGSGRLTRLVVGANALLSRLPLAVIANSSVAVDVHRAMKYRPKRFLVIPNGFDLERFVPNPEAGPALRAELNIPENAPLAGMAARFDPQKDFHTLAGAMREVLAVRPDVHFALCGDDVTPDNADLAAILEKAGVEANVRLLGRRTDMERVMAALDAGILSSAYGEGFPNVVGEAMACGTPCAVTDVGDSAEVVGEAGAVVPPGDPKALARALLGILELPPRRRAELGRAARERIRERFSLSAVAASYQDLYSDLYGR